MSSLGAQFQPHNLKKAQQEVAREEGGELRRASQRAEWAEGAKRSNKPILLNTVGLLVETQQYHTYAHHMTF